jgi:uncharacterized membrane protein YgcG
VSVRIALALAILLTAFGTPARAVERILNFISDVTVQRSGDLIVTETITVQAEGNQIRRGILRDFPTTYRRPDGARVEVGFDVQAVTRDGSPETFVVERLNNGYRIRIGSADRILDNGPHTYGIRYRTTRQIGFFPSYDELYWNATGTGWTFTIDQAEARITLPEAVPFRQTAIYTGPQGARGQDATIVEQRPGRIVFRTTKPLPRENGMTVAAAWQKGVVTEPSSGQEARWWLADNAAVPIAIAGIILLLGYYYYAWTKVGRDPPKGTIIPLFGPPGSMSAAAVRYVDNLGFDQRCFTAAIVDLGVHGHLRISENGKQQLEHRANGRPVPPPETHLAKRLFEEGSPLALTQTNHTTLDEARTALREGLESAYLGKLFTNNYGWSGLGLAAAIALVVLIVAGLGSSHPGEQAGGLVMGLLLPLLFIAGGAGMIYGGMQRDPISLWRVVVGAVIAGAAALIGFAIMGATARGWVDLVPGIAADIAAAIAGVAFPWLQAPSVEGRRTMDQIEGFKEYLGVAEEDRLNALNPPEKTPELFERFLPYAIALDVENAWANRFAAVLTAAGASAAVTSWYNGDVDWSHDPAGFADSLGSDLSRTIASAATAPGSSGGGDSGGGSSGGGSSGGGGGGGGGSGW